MVRLNPSSFRVLNQEAGTDTMQSVEGADHVGAYLREARETTGRSVGDVAQTLRIRRAYLEAIEDGRFDELPGAAYAVGFVRTYAKHLRLDVPAVVERFKEEASGIQSPQHLDFPTPVPEGRFPGGIVVTLSLIVAAGIFGGWYWYQNRNAVDVVQVPPPPVTAAPAQSSTTEGESVPPVSVPATDVASAPAPPVVATGAAPVGPALADAEADAQKVTATTEPPAVEAQSAQAPVAPPVASPVAPVVSTAPPQTAGTSTPPEPAPAATAPATEAATDTPAGATQPVEVARTPAAPTAPTAVPDTDGEGRIYGVAGDDVRIVLAAHENTWVQVRDADENVVLTQMLQAGDRYFVPARIDLRLMTGNAGGLDISVDGEPVPAIGARGEARRDVRLEADLLKSGQAVVR